MSVSKNQYEAERWLLTAAEDIQAGRALSEKKMVSHVCFLAQQSAGKSLKAIWLFFDYEPWGHSILKLIKDYPQSNLFLNMSEWLERGAYLDRCYIPTRYPNGLPDLTPGQSYFQKDAEQALEYSAFFLESCRAFVKKR